jgi:4-amino-4-deoxy-L-arabinose transferase-like glycosyltransferase
MRESPTFWERLALIAIVAVGAWLRFQNIGDIEYNIDQVYPIWQAIQTLDAGQWPLVGQGTSVLFANPPLTGYLFAPVIALVRQPLAAYAVTLTLNTFAIWLAYRALRWLIGTRPALVGAALFAVNPWIVEDSRRTWVQSLAPFFVCLIFWALAPVLTGQTRHPARRTLIALIGLALFAHTYLLAYALVAPVGLLLALFWRRIPKRALIAGIAFFAILMTLYGIGLARHWDDTSRRADDFASGDARLSSEALRHALRLVTGSGYATERGQRAPAGDADVRDTLSDLVHVLWTAALLLGLLRALLSFLSRLRFSVISVSSVVQDSPLILLVWFLLPVLMMSYASRMIHPFYLLLTVPAGHGLAAWGVAPLLEKRSPQSAQRSQRFSFTSLSSLCPLCSLWLIIVFLVFTTTINGLNAIRFAQQTAVYPGEDLPETLPLAQATLLGQRLRDAGAPELAVFSLMNEWTPITLVGRNFRTEITGTYGRAALVPPNGGLVVLFQKPGDPPPITPPFAHPAGAPLGLTDGTRIVIWRVTPDDLSIDHPADIPSDIGLRFLGWTLDGDLTPGGAATLTTFWRVEALHPDRGIWSFLPVANVVDVSGAQVASDQGHAVSGLTWAVGDVMVQRLDLALPADAAGPFAIQLSLFDPARIREDSTVGINAVFQVSEGEEIEYTATISISVP